jgi:Xaa-Pro aminopeptidase
MRFNKIANLLNKLKVDALLISSTPNVSYCAGFFAPDSYLVITNNKAVIITDSRYASDFARKIKPPFTIKEYKNSVFKTIIRTFRQIAVKEAGFESRHLTFAECEILCSLGSKHIKFIPLKETIEPLREIKEGDEIKTIKKAIAITLEAFAYIEKMLKPGVSELEIAAHLERFIRLQGATSSAFDIIVASGPNSSYPHAGISSRVMQKTDAVIIDAGVAYNGYKCDLTRTWFLGKIKPVAQKAYRIVSEAQKRAIKAIRPGVTAKSIDLAARNYIAEKGFDRFFGHSLGHGVGLEVHESPSINRKNHRVINANMVFTVEPGIYIPGEFGIRIEDMVLVKESGAEVLSGNHSDKSD